jgi:hypothetical protein
MSLQGEETAEPTVIDTTNKMGALAKLVAVRTLGLRNSPSTQAATSPVEDPQAKERAEMEEVFNASKLRRGLFGPSTPITQADLDSARDILAEVDGTVPIVVIPDTWNLSGDNPAITLLEDAQISNYKKQLTKAGPSYKDLDVAELEERLAAKTILVKQSALKKSPIFQRGVIWHEFGHTFLGATENGDVFAHELTCLRNNFEDSEVISYVKNERGLDYLAKTAIDPGLENLKGILKDLGCDLEGRKRALAEKELASKRSKLKPGYSLIGKMAEFKSRAASTEDLPADFANMDPNTQFNWTGFVWVMHAPSTVYIIDVVKNRREELTPGKRLEGTPTQLKTRAGATTDPPDGIVKMEPETVFDWDNDRWKLMNSSTIYHIEIARSI